MNWEPWTGCYKVSDGCTYCYFYGPYSKRCGQNTGSFFKRDGIVQKVNPFKQNSLAKELDINIMGAKKLF